MLVHSNIHIFVQCHSMATIAAHNLGDLHWPPIAQTLCLIASFCSYFVQTSHLHVVCVCVCVCVCVSVFFFVFFVFVSA